MRKNHINQWDWGKTMLFCLFHAFTNNPFFFYIYGMRIFFVHFQWIISNPAIGKEGVWNKTIAAFSICSTLTKYTLHLSKWEKIPLAWMKWDKKSTSWCFCWLEFVQNMQKLACLIDCNGTVPWSIFWLRTWSVLIFAFFDKVRYFIFEWYFGLYKKFHEIVA